MYTSMLNVLLKNFNLTILFHISLNLKLSSTLYIESPSRTTNYEDGNPLLVRHRGLGEDVERELDVVDTESRHTWFV